MKLQTTMIRDYKGLFPLFHGRFKLLDVMYETVLFFFSVHTSWHLPV